MGNKQEMAFISLCNHSLQTFFQIPFSPLDSIALQAGNQASLRVSTWSHTLQAPELPLVGHLIAPNSLLQ